MTLQIIEALSKFLWPLLALVVWFFYRTEIREVLATVGTRLKSGASLRVAGVELGSVTVVSPGTGDQAYVTKLALEGGAKVIQDDGSYGRHREVVYQETHRLQLVHRLLSPASTHYLFDIVLYVIPHKEASTLGVKYVDYFFGPYWGDQVFRVETRYNAFAIQTSAYGPFLCTARITFNDGSTANLARYIDFEMGGLVLQRERPTRGEKSPHE